MEGERKHWLLSRKFWLAFLTAITMILADEPEVLVSFSDCNNYDSC